MFKLTFFTLQLNPRDQKKADEEKLNLRKGLLDRVNTSIRATLSSLSIEVRCSFIVL